MDDLTGSAAQWVLPALFIISLWFLGSAGPVLQHGRGSLLLDVLPGLCRVAGRGTGFSSPAVFWDRC